MNKKPKILVVDDDVGVIRLLEKRLEAQNFEIISAINGKQGIKQAKEQEPDLILLDIMMPDLSGAEVTKELKKSEEAKDIPIIFITVTISKKADKLGKEIEIDGQLYDAFAKPLYFPKLLSVINKKLKSRQ